MQLPPGQIQEVDLPEVMESFSDSLGMSMFDGHTARITFSIHRVYKIEPPKPPFVKKYPVCRMVLTPQAIVELFNQLNGMVGVMVQKGLVKQEQGKPPEVVDKSKIN